MSGKKRSGPILVVDDDKIVREMLTNVLENAGYTVEQATHGLEALGRLWQDPKPSVVLLDLMLPRFNGWQFRAAQRNEPTLAAIPVVILSGWTLTAAEALSLDAEGYFCKPFNTRALLDTVAYCCPEGPAR